MSHPINNQVIRARRGTVVRREQADIVRVVRLDGVSSDLARLRFTRELLWLRSMEYEVQAFAGREETDSHGPFIDVGRPLDSLNEVIEKAQSVATRRGMRRDGENACEARILIRDHAVIEVPEELRAHLYESYRSGSDPVYLPTGEDWWRADNATLDAWLAQPWHERDIGLIERLREARQVFSGVVWSSRWTDVENAQARAAATALAVP